MTQEQVDKAGNAMIYIATHVPYTSKTKMLKLLFLIEEEVIKKSNLPFLGLPYYAWKRGPVQVDIYNDMVSPAHRYFGKYIDIQSQFVKSKSHSVILAKADFCDDEFSDFEIDIMNDIIRKYKDWNTEELVDETHKSGSLWADTIKQYNITFDNSDKSDCLIDMTKLLDDQGLSIYFDYLEANQFAAHFHK